MLVPANPPPGAQLSPFDRARIYGVPAADLPASARMVRRDLPPGEARALIVRGDSLPTAPSGPLVSRPE